MSSNQDSDPIINSTMFAARHRSPGVTDVEIHFRGKVQVTIALLSDGMFSLVSHTMVHKHLDAVVLALGQLVFAHVASSPDSIGEAHVLNEIAQLEAGFAATGPMTWVDLPGAFTTYFVAPEDTIYLGLRVGRQAAIYVSIRDSLMAFAWARFSTSTPDENFCLALGRVVISNFHAVSPEVRGG